MLQASKLGASAVLQQVFIITEQTPSEAKEFLHKNNVDVRKKF